MKEVNYLDKKLDAKGRWRNKASSFMMSPEEWEDLDTRVRLSGLTKQEYMIRRLLERDVVVQPNTRVFKALRYFPYTKGTSSSFLKEILSKI